jgi:salicylate hydroxylase
MAAPVGRRERRGLDISKLTLAGIPAERYLPKRSPAGTILRFHGGGFITGSVATERRVAAQVALATGCDTYGITYRLAPQHPYPAAVDDAVTAYRELLRRGVAPATTILFGGSAGAGLALAALLRIRAEDLPMPGGAVLLWPYADFTFSGESIDTFAEIDMLPVRDVAPVWGPAYVGGANPSDPFVSPALADLHGLPPLLVIAGGAESLLSSAERIAANARSSGVDVTLSVYPEKVHGWMILPHLPATKDATAELTTWIAARLGVAPDEL